MIGRVTVYMQIGAKCFKRVCPLKLVKYSLCIFLTFQYAFNDKEVNFQTACQNMNCQNINNIYLCRISIYNSIYMHYQLVGYFCCEECI